MRISGFTTTRPNMAGTRTAEEFMKFLGARPERLGIVSTLYDQYTATHLTEALMNTYTMDKGKKGFQAVNTFLIEWDLKVNKIKRVPIISVSGTGANAGDVQFYFGENYYQKYDTFMVEKTRQQFIVLQRPQRISDAKYLVVAKIVDNDYDSQVITPANGTFAGAQTRFVTNWQPELSKEGYVKYQSNTEKFRTYLGLHRVDVDESAIYNALEDVFIQIGKGDKDDPVYQMNTAEKDCLDTFMEARNNALLWGKNNMDENGKAKFVDPDDNQPIMTSDGVIAQIDRFATKFVFSKMNVAYFEKAMAAMRAKSEKSSGNTWVMLSNTLFYDQWQRVMGSWIGDHHTDGAYLYSKAANGNVNLGATYEAYNFAGNQLVVKCDRSLDVEYPDRPYAMILDLTPDGASGRAAMAFFCLKGWQFIHNVIEGAGTKEGVVSSPITAKKHIMLGSGSTAVFNPYKSVIMIGEQARDAAIIW